jgi:hypothetical protein
VKSDPITPPARRPAPAFSFVVIRLDVCISDFSHLFSRFLPHNCYTLGGRRCEPSIMGLQACWRERARRRSSRFSLPPPSPPGIISAGRRCVLPPSRGRQGEVRAPPAFDDAPPAEVPRRADDLDDAPPAEVARRGRRGQQGVQDGQLLAQGQVLQDELAAWQKEQSENAPDSAKQSPAHLSAPEDSLRWSS